MRLFWNSLCVVAILLVGVVSPASAEPIPTGASSFKFIDQKGNKDRPITVWTYRPSKFTSGGNVVIVMHGKGRNGEEYRNVWIELAKKYNFLLLSPEFSKKQYPDDEMYQQGYVTAAGSSEVRDQQLWSLTAIERVFDQVVSDNSLTAKKYFIYGHSGGGQFVHRLILMYPEARVELAIAANPGWYTMPDESIDFPYGLRKTPTDRDRLKAAFSKPLVILLGEQDIDPNHKSLRRTADAMLQGQHRFARGNNFFATAQKIAVKRDQAFNWKLKTVRNAEHSNAQMAPTAAALINDR